MLSRDGSLRKLRSSSALHGSAAWVRRFGSSSRQFGDVCRRPRCQERSAKKGIMSCRGPCENVARHASLPALRPQGHTAPSNMKQMIQMPQLRSITFPELTHSQRSNDSSGAQATIMKRFEMLRIRTFQAAGAAPGTAELSSVRVTRI